MKTMPLPSCMRPCAGATMGQLPEPSSLSFRCIMCWAQHLCTKPDAQCLQQRPGACTAASAGSVLPRPEADNALANLTSAGHALEVTMCES